MKLNADQISKLALLAILIITLLLFLPDIFTLYENTENILKNSPVSPIFYSLLMIIAILVSPIPASPLAILAGSLYGPFLGMVYTLISATIGAMLAFLIARFFLKDSAGRWLEKHEWFRKIEGKDSKNIALIVFATRLMPQISFDLVSYAAGLTSINIFVFALATLIGMIPIVFLLSFFGSFISPYMFWFLTILFLLFITYVVYKIIKTKSNNPADNK